MCVPVCVCLYVCRYVCVIYEVTKSRMCATGHINRESNAVHILCNCHIYPGFWPHVGPNVGGARVRV